ncbi:hypothetical protein G6F31_014570 [Rhizopus arrhizus]|nr:hypothetical protein G6F31_014570 [Rhizopus arrhizus]
MGIGGAFLGGIAVAAFGFRRMLLVAALGVALSNLAFLLMAHNPGKLWAFYAALSADNLFQGFAGTVLVAFMSSLTDRNFTATQYALLVSLANLPGKFHVLHPQLGHRGADTAAACLVVAADRGSRAPAGRLIACTSGLRDHRPDAPRGRCLANGEVSMADVVLRDLDPLLLDRIRRVAVARGWTHEQTCAALLEQGLFSSELEVRSGFGDPEVDALSDAIAALQALPAGQGFD